MKISQTQPITEREMMFKTQRQQSMNLNLLQIDDQLNKTFSLRRSATTVKEERGGIQELSDILNDSTNTQSQSQCKLDILDQVHNEWKCQNLTETPFDHVQLIQTMNIAARPYEVITVKLITQNVRHHSKIKEEEQKKAPNEDSCPICNNCLIFHKFSSRNKNKKFQGTKTCQNDLCRSEIEAQNSYYQCSTCNGSGLPINFCIECVTLQNTRKRIQSKTKMQKFYEDIHFQTHNDAHEVIAVQESSITMTKTIDFRSELMESTLPQESEQNIYAQIDVLKPETYQKSDNIDILEYDVSRLLTRSDTIGKQPLQVKIQNFFSLRIHMPLCIERSGAIPLSEFLFLKDDRQKVFYFNQQNGGRTLHFNLMDLTDFTAESCVVTGEAAEVISSGLNESKVEFQSPLLFGDTLCIQSYKRDLFCSQAEDRTCYFFINIKTWEIQSIVEQALILLNQVDKNDEQVKSTFWYLKTNKTLVQAVWPQSGQQLRILKQFTLPRLKTRRWDHKKVEGYIHSYGTRCTLLVRDENWYTFQLDQEPKEILKHEVMRDAAIFRETTISPKLKLVGNMQLDLGIEDWDRPSEEKTPEKFDYKMMIFDLDEPEMKQNKQRQQFSKIAQQIVKKKESKITFRLPSEWNFDNLPRQTMPFTTVQGKNSLSQLFYQDQATGQVNVLFLNAQVSQNSLIRKSSIRTSTKLSMPTWMMPQMQYLISYPILCYTTHLPDQKELMLVNLAKNRPQKRLNLDVSVICLCECGPQNSNTLQLTTIYFLAWDCDNNVGLYKITIDPWADMHDEYTLTKVMITLNSGGFVFNQIKKACVIRSITRGEIEKFAVVLQQPNQVLVLEDDSKVQAVINREFGVELLHKPLVCGVHQRCYFVQKSERVGCEIMIIAFDQTSEQFTCKSAYKQKDAILHFQMNSFEPEIKEDMYSTQGQLLLIDKSYTMRLIQFQSEKKFCSEPKFVEKDHWKLSEHSIKRVIRALEQVPWSTCLLSENAMISARVEQFGKIYWQSYIYGVESHSHSRMPYFERAKDSQKRYDIVGQLMDKNSCEHEMLFKCQDIQPIRYTNKNFSVLSDDFSGYSCFLTSQSLSQQRVDLMTYIHQFAHQSETFVLKSFILVQLKTNFLVFSQETQLLICMHSGRVELQENVSDCENDTIVLVDKQRYCTFKPDGSLRVIWSRDQFQKAGCEQLEEAINKSQDALSFAFFHKAEQFYNKKPIVTKELVQFHQNEADSNVDVTQFSIIKVIQSPAQYQELPASLSELYYIYVWPSKQKRAKKMRTLLTDSHFLIQVKNKIWIFKQSRIREYQGELAINLKDFKYEEPSVIDLNQMFEGRITCQGGINLQHVRHQDILILENMRKVKQSGKYTQIKRDAIQITFTEVAVIWDLDHNSEISTLEHITDFGQDQNYTRTGFKYFRIESDVKKFKMNVDTAFLQTNPETTLISAPLTKKNFSVLYRTYTLLELLQIKFIEYFFKKNGLKALQQHHINLDLLVTNIRGETFFSRFYEEPKILDLACSLVSDRGYETNEDVSQDSMYIRNLFYTLCLPFTSNEDKDDDGKDDVEQKPFQWVLNLLQKYMRPQYEHVECYDQINKHNIVQWMIAKDQSGLDRLLQLMLMSSEVQLRTLVQNFKQFKALFSIQSNEMQQFLDNAFVRTPMSKRLTTLKWDHDQPILAFTANTAELSTEKIEKEAESAGLDTMFQIAQNAKKKIKQFYDIKAQSKPVEVKIVDIRWLNDHIPEFYKYLANSDELSIFDNAIIKVLLKRQNYTNQIILKIFIPYCVYSCLMLFYFLKYVPGRDEPNGFFDLEFPYQSAIRVLATLIMIFLSVIELQQIIFLKLNYWSDIWNYGNISSLVINEYILLEHSTKFSGFPEADLARLTSIACVMLSLMLFYWMRLFPKLAFYVKMLTETIWDLRHFMIFFFMIISTFSFAVQIIDSYNMKVAEDDGTEYKGLYRQQTDGALFDSWINQYLLGVGDYYFITYNENNDRSLQWVYFVMATFFTNIVFLNMLIAIMGDTFDRLTEKKQRNGTIQQTQMIADFMQNLSVNKYFNTHRFLYMISPITQEEVEADVWEGGYNKIKDSITNMEVRQTSFLKKKMRGQSAQMRDIFSQLQLLYDVQRRTQTTLDQSKNLMSKQNTATTEILGSTMRSDLKSLITKSLKESHTSSSCDSDDSHITVKKDDDPVEKLSYLIKDMNHRFSNQMDQIQRQTNKQQKEIKKIQVQVLNMMKPQVRPVPQPPTSPDSQLVELLLPQLIQPNQKATPNLGSQVQLHSDNQ